MVVHFIIIILNSTLLFIKCHKYDFKKINGI